MLDVVVNGLKWLGGGVKRYFQEDSDFSEERRKALIFAGKVAVLGGAYLLLPSCVREKIEDSGEELEKKLAEAPTIAHLALDLESDIVSKEVTNQAKKNLDDIIKTATTELSYLKEKKSYDLNDAKKFLETIDEIIKKRGYRKQSNDLLSEGLSKKVLDCYDRSLIYLSIAEALKLPEGTLKAVDAPKHMFVRFFLSGGTYVNLEVNSRPHATLQNDAYYKKLYNISEKAIKNGVYLRSQTTKETIGHIYSAKGSPLSDKEEYDEAIKCYDKAIELDPKYSNAYNNKGWTLFKKEEYDEAIKCYDKAIELDPNCSGAYSNKGLALLKKEEYDEAIECCDKAIELDPNNSGAYSNKTAALIELDRFDEVIEQCEIAIKLDPKNKSVHNNKGVALYKQEKYDEAIKCYNKALEIDPNFKLAQENKKLALEEKE